MSAIFMYFKQSLERKPQLISSAIQMLVCETLVLAGSYFGFVKAAKLQNSRFYIPSLSFYKSDYGLACSLWRKKLSYR